MDDLKKQLRRHYEGQQLPDDRVQEILALGRAAGEARTSRAWWRTAAAAAVLLCAGIICATAHFRGRGGPPPITAQSVASTVVNILSDPAHQLPVVSADHEVLVEWLRQHGGPASFQVPPAMSRLSSVGCEILEVRNQKVFIICFFLEPPPTDSPAGAMPAKKAMVTIGADGRAMQKVRPLAHLVVAPKAMFSVPPRTGEPVFLPLDGSWNLATWSRGDDVYLAAAPLSAAQLAGLVAAM